MQPNHRSSTSEGPPHTPSRGERRSTSEAVLNYVSPSRSPDTRRTYYKSNHTTLTRQQLREQRLQRQQKSMQRADSTMESTRRRQQNQQVYMDIDPSIHLDPSSEDYPYHTHADADADDDAGYNTERRARSGPTNNGTESYSDSSCNPKSPSRFRSFNCTTPARSARAAEVQPHTPPSSSSTPTTTRPPSRASTSSNSNSQQQQHLQQSQPHSSQQQQPQSSFYTNICNESTAPRREHHFTYVNPYVSPVAQEYRVPGGMFPHQPSPAAAAAVAVTGAAQNTGFHTIQNRSSSSSSSNDNNNIINDNNNSSNNNGSRGVWKKNSPYNGTPIGPKKYGFDEPYHNKEGLIMFGDDYDLGSINTGMSQQELLQKRRDVKKRREGKNNGKKKKQKERIVNMPPRLLSMGSWDTSPITKFTSKDNSHHTLYREDRDDGIQSAQQQQQQQQQQLWGAMRGIASPKEEDTGSTAVSTRGSGDSNHHLAVTSGTNNRVVYQSQNRNDGWTAAAQASPSDNASLSSFPLLSTNAKEGLATEEMATVQYMEPGHIPQIQLQERVAIAVEQQQQLTYDTRQHQQLEHQQEHQQMQHQHQHQQEHQQHQQEHQQRAIQQPRIRQRQPAQTTPQSGNAQQHQPQLRTQHQFSSKSPRPQYIDIYQRQHSTELQQLEQHLSYLEDQHQQLEREIQDRQRQQQVNDPNAPGGAVPPDYEDDRPRAVTFAERIARDIDENHEAPSDESESRIHKDSPTSVAHFNNSSEQDKSNNTSTSMISPKTLFSAPKSILRRKIQQPLDSTGRIPGVHRGRTNAPKFTDATGRELSPIRSPGRQQSNQRPAYGLQANALVDDVGSVPENPGENDAAVLFDPDKEAEKLFLKRDFDDESGVMSDAFIEAVAAIVLQTAIRRFLAIRKTQKLSKNKALRESYDRRVIEAVPSVKATITGAAVGNTTYTNSPCNQTSSGRVNPMSQEDFFYDLAAIQIQSVFRGWWVRDSIAVDTYCAKLIQTTWRSKKAQLDFDYDMYRIILVQSIWRRKLIMLAMRPQGRRMQYTYQTRQQTVMTVSAQKQPLLQPSYSEEDGIRQVAAIIIQTYWRSYVASICYFQSISDVIVVQSVSRRWLVRRKMGMERTPEWHRVGSITAGPHNRYHSNPQRHGGRFVKLGSFEAGVDGSMASSNKKMSSLGESTVPSIPFCILADDDPDQPPSLTPPRKGKLQLQETGHYEDPSRFGGSKDSWQENGHGRKSSVSHASSYYNRSHRTTASNSDSVRGQSAHSTNRPTARSNGEGSSSPPAQLTTVPGCAQEVPRSKGWNPEEEIDKEGTRNLLMAWKQRETKTFSIQSRSEL